MDIRLTDWKTRSELDGETLRKNYKNAINQYQKSLEEENYIVSFILSTTLYEERLNICYLLLKWYENDKNFDMEKKPTQSDIIEVHSIDRLGRDTLSVLSVWKELTDKGVRVVCRNPNFQNLNDDGERDYFSELLLNILSTMSSFEKSMIKTRQMEGIRITQKISPEKYSGRKQNTKESTLTFLTKHSKAVEYLEKGMMGVEVSKLCDISLNTITKIKKNLQPQQKVA